ncbi:unnamed protein product [Medioppia subpectinata]|uniref:Uncharacterized protein n=1 Tax=Medioppia subpectinata TaxID=1979941 RepID=A0A7R9PV27_9ACAR|nr:unnamed protein product [Medioppia subpectinata]CAG2102210.1 unnamed protein product [Medioppia subpectinata]
MLNTFDKIGGCTLPNYGRNRTQPVGAECRVLSPYQHSMDTQNYCVTIFSQWSGVRFRKTLVKHEWLIKSSPDKCFVGLTRDECLIRCRIEEGLARYSTLSPLYLSYESGNHSLYFANYINSSDFDDLCDSRCDDRVECVQYFYSIEYNTERAPNLADGYAIVVEFPSEPTTVYEIIRKMPFEEFLCLLGSISSLWFGFSLLLLTRFCEKIVTDWAFNATKKPLEALMSVYPPLLTYNEWETVSGDNTSVLYYQYCGPFILLLRTLSSYIDTNFVIKAHQKERIVDLSTALTSDIIVYPVTSASNYLQHMGYELSTTIGSVMGDMFISKPIFYERPVFDFLTDCWDEEIYYWILLSVLVFSLVLGLKYQSTGKFIENIWHFSTILLSDYMPFRGRRLVVSDRRFVGPWLIVCAILLPAYSRVMYWKIIGGDHHYGVGVDNLWQLYAQPEWQNSKIFVVDTDPFVTPDYYRKDLMPVRVMANRVDYIDGIDMYFNTSLFWDMFDRVVAQNAVIKIDRLFGHHLLASARLAYRYVRNVDYTMADSWLKSRDYRLAVGDAIPTYIFNWIIGRMKESGVFDRQVIQSSMMYGFGPNVYDNDVAGGDGNVNKVITLDQMMGVFWLFGLGVAVSIGAQFTEFIARLIFPSAPIHKVNYHLCL